MDFGLKKQRQVTQRDIFARSSITAIVQWEFVWSKLRLLIAADLRILATVATVHNTIEMIR